MAKKFNRIVCSSNMGYEVTHTEGVSAEGSTISYPHQVPMCMLYYFIQGSGNIIIEGKQYNINDGDVIILNPTELFCCSVDANKYHERIVLHFSDRVFKGFPIECELLFAPFLSREKGSSNHIPSEIVKEHSLDTSLKALFKIANSKKIAVEAVTICKIADILSTLCDISTKQKADNPEISIKNPVINLILKYLNANFKNDITIETIASEFNLDKSYISHLFKENVGVSLWNYVIFRRVSYFNEIVKSGKNIEEASRDAGFKNYSNFYRIYKKHTGITPMEFKRECNTKKEL